MSLPVFSSRMWKAAGMRDGGSGATKSAIGEPPRIVSPAIGATGRAGALLGDPGESSAAEFAHPAVPLAARPAGSAKAGWLAFRLVDLISPGSEDVVPPTAPSEGKWIGREAPAGRLADPRIVLVRVRWSAWWREVCVARNEFCRYSAVLRQV